jgi:hypothetical protein
MNITQGPLPPDGSIVDPGVFLEAWIAGTQVYDLPAGAFKGGQLQFVWSQSEAPALADRYIGLLWFKRGEGRLYQWDSPDLPSNPTFSDVGWIALSDRREIWCRAACPVALGAPCSFLYTNYSGAADLIHNPATVDQEANPRPIWSVHSHSSPSGASNTLSEMVLVALDTAPTGTLFKCVELGFVDAIFGSGVTGAGGVAGLHETSRGWFLRDDPTCGTFVRYMPIAQTLDSSASSPASEWLRPIYKHSMPIIGLAAVS